jgi:hypothetical protein
MISLGILNSGKPDRTLMEMNVCPAVRVDRRDISRSIVMLFGLIGVLVLALAFLGAASPSDGRLDINTGAITGNSSSSSSIGSLGYKLAPYLFVNTSSQKAALDRQVDEQISSAKDVLFGSAQKESGNSQESGAGDTANSSADSSSKDIAAARQQIFSSSWGGIEQSAASSSSAMARTNTKWVSWLVGICAVVVMGAAGVLLSMKFSKFFRSKKEE